MKQSSSAESKEGRESGAENLRRERKQLFQGNRVQLLCNTLKRSVINLNLCSWFCSLNISMKKEHGFGPRMRGQGLEVSCVNRDTLLHWQSLMFFICEMEVVDSAQWGDCTY